MWFFTFLFCFSSGAVFMLALLNMHNEDVGFAYYVAACVLMFVAAGFRISEHKAVHAYYRDRK